MGKDIWDMYKPGEIVYPSAIARYYKIPVKKAEEQCKSRVGKALRELFLIHCPCCMHDASNMRFYKEDDIPEEMSCIHCGEDFTVHAENICIVYEKLDERISKFNKAVEKQREKMDTYETAEWNRDIFTFE